MIYLSAFHFLRPLFLLLLPLVVVLYFLRKNTSPSSVWAKAIAPHLLSHLLLHKEKTLSVRFSSFVMPTFLILLIVAMAGPTVTKLPSDSGYKKTPLIIALEVSEAMLAKDLAPSRLKRALFKLEDLFKTYKGAEVALIAFAGEAHIVVPLSEDYNTILSLAKTLSPDLMPLKGINLSNALKKAEKMAERTPKAQVLLITSTALDDADAFNSALKKTHVPVSIWAFTTTPSLKDMNADGRAKSIPWTPGNEDVLSIAKMLERGEHEFSLSSTYFDSWKDLGPYVLILAVMVLLLGFFFARERMWIFSILLFIQAPKLEAFSFSDLFLRRDQQAELALTKGEPLKAAELFEDDLRKGLSYYRAKDYKRAIDHLSKVNTSQGLYNLGNAYAKNGQMAEAISSYDRALKLDPNNKDAKFNKELLEKNLEKQPNKDQQQQENQEQDQQKNQDQSQKNDQSKDQPKDQPKEQKSPENKPEPKKEEQGKDQPKSEPPKENQEQSGSKPEEEKAKPEQMNKENQGKEGAEQKGEVKPQSEQKLDKDTLYHFQKLEQPSKNLYLQRKFKQELLKDREAK